MNYTILTSGNAKNSSNQLTSWRYAVRLVIASVVLGCFAFSPPARAADGGLPNENTAEGDGALFSLGNGFGNTAVGFNALFSNKKSSYNTSIGAEALSNNTTGTENTASGFRALFSNTSGGLNTATGVNALASNTKGERNTACGHEALISNRTGLSNTASGDLALQLNTSGSFNTASGEAALEGNRTGNFNAASGAAALEFNRIGNNNTADGFGALFHNTIGSSNAANGFEALFNNKTGNNNIALGDSSGINLTTGNNNIDIGNVGVEGESDHIRIGTVEIHKRTFIAGISGVTVPGGVEVVVGPDGKLGTIVSSERFKAEIKPMERTSEAILGLQPVTFHYKDELDPEAIPQFGLIAEQVEKVNPDLVAHDEQGKPYTVRYEAVNAMLLNEFLKEHRKVEALEAKVAQHQSVSANQQKAIEALMAGFQKLNDRAEIGKTVQPGVAITP